MLLMLVSWRCHLFLAFTFLLPIEVENLIEVGEKLIEVASCWGEVVVNGFNMYSPSIVSEYLFLIVIDLARKNMFGQFTLHGEGMT